MINQFEKLIDILKDSQTFLIISHKNPDGDTIGANFGLSLSLIKIGKKVISYCDNNIPFEYQFLINNKLRFICNEDAFKTQYDTVIMVDCADKTRISKFDYIKKISNIIINIDHHKTNDRFGDLNIVYPDYSSTGEIIFEILSQGKLPITKEIAECLYTAILTDTGSFRYSNTNPNTFKIAAKLLDFGVNCWEIAEKVYENKPYKRILLLKEALNSLFLSDNKKAAVMIIPKDILKKYNATGEDTDGFVNYGRSISGVEISIFIREEDDGCKLSFRSRGNLDVSKLAAKFNGGGHKNAAGAFIPESVQKTKEILLKILKENGF